MRIHKIDLDEVELRNSILIFTTNGNIKKDGRAVMGRGIAKYVRDNLLFFDEEDLDWKKPDIVLGTNIYVFGNRPFLFYAKRKNQNEEFYTISFPTKYNWWERSNLKLIENSIKETIYLLRTNYFLFYDIKRIFIPLFATENGRLKFEDIKPLLNYFVTIIKKETNFDIIVFQRKDYFTSPIEKNKV